jgi:predicted nucleic acid-binding protein
MTRFSLDSNVLIYAADGRAGLRHARALHVLILAARRDCLLTLQALGEFFHVSTRKRIVARHDAAAQVRDLLARPLPLTLMRSQRPLQELSRAEAASGTVSWSRPRLEPDVPTC